MANVQVLHAVGTDVSASTSTYVDVATIAASSFTPNANYFIVALGCYRVGSSANDGLVRLVHGTTPTAFDDMPDDREVTNATQETAFGWFFKFTQPSTPELVKIQVANISTSTTTVEFGVILAFNLDDIGIEGTHWGFDEVLADYTTTASFVSQASETFTANGSDVYLVLGNGIADTVSISTNYRMRLNDSVAGALQTIDVEGEDITNDKRAHLLMAAYIPSSASHTVSMQFNHETDAHTIFASRIGWINLTAVFAQVVFASNAAQQQPAASPSWTTTLGVDPTPTNTGNWVVLGSFTNDVGTLTDDLATRLQINPSGGGLASNPAYGDSAPGADSWDATDIMGFVIGTLVSLTSGAAREINLDVQMVAGTTLRVQERFAVAFSVEKVSGPAFPPVPGEIHRQRASPLLRM